jgi:thiamine biosynthesis lipoprotein
MKRLQERRTALGSDCLLTLVVEPERDVTDIFASLWRDIVEFEQRFSRFLETSELSKLNRMSGTKVSISMQFQTLLETCTSMSQLSDSLFSPFILPSLQQAGYIGSWPEPTSFKPDLNYQDRKQVATSSLIELGKGWAKIPNDTALDMGGIGKGYLLDQLAGQLHRSNVSNFWLSLGGDIICSGQDLEEEAWNIGVQAVGGTGRTVKMITNSQKKTLAIATSGTTKRKGSHNSKAWHHIIDPRTGMPAETDIATGTVTAETATWADVAAKCLVILGSEVAIDFCKRHELKACLQLTSGEVLLA